MVAVTVARGGIVLVMVDVRCPRRVHSGHDSLEAVRSHDGGVLQVGVVKIESSLLDRSCRRGEGITKYGGVVVAIRARGRAVVPCFSWKSEETRTTRCRASEPAEAGFGEGGIHGVVYRHQRHGAVGVAVAGPAVCKVGGRARTTGSVLGFAIAEAGAPRVGDRGPGGALTHGYTTSHCAGLVHRSSSCHNLGADRKL